MDEVVGLEGPEVRIVLTPEQSDLINSLSGTVTRQLRYSRREAMLTALCLEALERGTQLPSIRYPVVFALTADQAECVRSTTGLSVRTWFVDADRGPVRYAEDWDGEHDGPIPLGTRLTLVHGDLPTEAVPLDHIVLLDPEGGRVFGTGRHEATQLAVELLEEQLRPGSEALDVGTGSGVLAMAMIKLGAGHVWAFETDAEAVALARRNVTRNGMDGRIRITPGELTAGERRFDLAVANIITPVVIDLLPELRRVVKPDGIVIASGMPVARAPDVLEAASANGFREIRVRPGEKWAAVALRRVP